MEFENTLKLGNGIYTIVEISQILGIPYQKARAWLNNYWDGQLGKAYKQKYSWQIGDSKAVGFHTLIEFYVMMQFAEAGVKPKQVLKAHKELSALHKTAFPFALKEVLKNIKTDGKTIYLYHKGTALTLDGSKQFNLDVIKIFFKNLDFENDLLVSRFWPLGKKKKVLVDPHHQFGMPIVKDTNIQTFALYNLYLAKEPISFIAALYEIKPQYVKDAIEFHKKAA